MFRQNTIISRCWIITKLIVLVDNNRYKSGLRTAWGLSIYVNLGYKGILFDTGPDPSILEYNARMLGVDLRSVNIVVISHVHGDHIGGIDALVNGVPKDLYVPPGLRHSSIISLARKGFKVNVISSTFRLEDNVFITKPLYGPPWEQSLVVSTGKGSIVLVGCSHPGILEITRTIARELGVKPYMVIGGFHLIGSSLNDIELLVRELLRLGVEVIVPLHCSGDEVRFVLEHMYPSNTIIGGVGLVLEL